MLILLITVWFCFSKNETNCNFDVFRYLKKNFNYDITESTKIICITRQEYKERTKKECPFNKEETQKYINARWSTDMTSFIDSVYTLDENGNFNGYLIVFNGDSLGEYTMKYFKDGIKDSLWIYKRPGISEEHQRYHNGRPHGIWERIRPNGSKGYLKKFHHGIVVDTAYQWWPNGNILEIEVFRDGETVYHKCFSEDGKDEIPCP